MLGNKIVFLIIPTLEQGGAERVISELAEYFSCKDIDIHLILLAESIDFYSVGEKVKIHRLGFVNKGKLNKIISQIKVYFKLRRLLSDYKPDAVLSFMDKYNVFTILASIFLNLRVFVSDRSNPNKKISKVLLISKKIIYPYAYGIIAQTYLAKNKLKKLTNHNNIVVIPNPVKKVRVIPGVKKENIILNIGRMVPEKGQIYLLNAFSQLNYPDWKLVILGDGPLKSKLDQQVNSLNLQGKVIMPGSVKNIDEWLSISSIFVLSSVSEGFPNVLIEAMSSGLPCVSFDCDAGPRDIIQNNFNGILVNQGDIEGLKDTILDLIQCVDKRNSIAVNALNSKEIYSIKVIGKKYLNFLLQD